MDELNYLRKSLVYNIEIENDAKVLTIHMIDKDDSKPLVN
jgi:hypothetical protein